MVLYLPLLYYLLRVDNLRYGTVTTQLTTVPTNYYIFCSEIVPVGSPWDRSGTPRSNAGSRSPAVSGSSHRRTTARTVRRASKVRNLIIIYTCLLMLRYIVLENRFAYSPCN